MAPPKGEWKASFSSSIMQKWMAIGNCAPLMQTKSGREGFSFAPAADPNGALGDTPAVVQATTEAATCRIGDAANATSAAAVSTKVVISASEGRLAVIGRLRGLGGLR